jgi:non-heme chloroperoxidase
MNGEDWGMRKIAWTGMIAVTAALAALFVLQSLIELSRPAEGSGFPGDPRFGFEITSAERPGGLPNVENFEARDRSLVSYRHYRSARPGHVKLYLVHSETWDDLEFASLADALARNSIDVLTMTMRGHGESPRKRGDTSYIGQASDDLADLVTATAQPGDIVVVGGHSTGAAVAARMATAERGPNISGLVLLAPVLSPSFAASRENLGGWLLPITSRVVALSVQNAVGIHWSDSEVAVQYAVPAEVRRGNYGFSVTTDYSWRLFKSMQMRDADASDFRRIKIPFLTITGTDNEALYADRIIPSLKSLSPTNEYALIEKKTHFSIVNSKQTLAIIQN